MIEFLGILLFVAVTMFVAIYVVFWLAIGVLRLLIGTVLRILGFRGGANRLALSVGSHGVDCDAINPTGANYCRRCGRPLRPASGFSAVRRVAMF